MKEVQAIRIMKFIVLIFLILLPFSIVHAADYDNIAFMKYVPKELREKFPVCDEFLDIKWIDPKRYIGKMRANTYTDGKNKQDMYLLVFTKGWGNQSGSYLGGISNAMFTGFSITEEDFKSKVFDQFVRTSDWSYNRMVLVLSNQKSKRTKKLFENIKPIISKAKNNPGHGSTLSNFTKNICLQHPIVDGIFVVESRVPYAMETMMEEDQNHFAEIEKAATKQCGKIAKQEGSRCDMSKLPIGRSIDINFDNVDDYLTTVFFYRKDGTRDSKYFLYFSNGSSFDSTFIMQECHGWPEKLYMRAGEKAIYLNDCNLTKLTGKGNK